MLWGWMRGMVVMVALVVNVMVDMRSPDWSGIWKERLMRLGGLSQALCILNRQFLRQYNRNKSQLDITCLVAKIAEWYC